MLSSKNSSNEQFKEPCFYLHTKPKFFFGRPPGLVSQLSLSNTHSRQSRRGGRTGENREHKGLGAADLKLQLATPLYSGAQNKKSKGTGKVVTKPYSYFAPLLVTSTTTCYTTYYVRAWYKPLSVSPGVSTPPFLLNILMRSSPAHLRKKKLAIVPTTAWCQHKLTR